MNDATTSNIPTNIAAASTPATPAIANPTPATPSTILVSSAATPPLTPGWKTTEFWLTALGQIGLALAAVSGTLPANYALIAGAVGQAAYSVSRGMAKSKATPLPTMIAATPIAA